MAKLHFSVEVLAQYSLNADFAGQGVAQFSRSYVLILMADKLSGGVLLAHTGTTFASYRHAYQVRPPTPGSIKFEDECRELTTEEGLKELEEPPCTGVVFGTPPEAFGESTAEKYLWVVTSERVPFAQEIAQAYGFERGRLSHTNLTGGLDAHCGGEAWFTNESSIVMNGGSGRYPPRSPDELQAVALAIKATGYNVASMGWDTDVNAPARILRGTPQWL
jgi:hypothetical protein